MQQNIQDKIKEEFQRFINFSTLLDKPTRTYLVAYFKYKLRPNTYQLPELNDQYFRYFTKAIDQVFDIDGLIPLCNENEHITYQIVMDTLLWLRRTYQKMKRKEVFKDEKNALKNWGVTPLKHFTPRYQFMLNRLTNLYTKEEIDTNFYHKKLQTLIASKRFEAIPAENKQAIDILFTDLLAQWDALLNAKILAYQLTKLEEEEESYTELLAAKVEEYQKLNSLISPFTEYLGRYWDMSQALWQESSFEVLEKYHELLAEEDSVRELADLLGKMREAEIEIEEETFEKSIIRQEWISNPNTKAAIVGVYESNDLNNLVSAEVGLLASPQTEDLFFKKFADQSLLTFKYEDKELVKSEHKYTEVDRKIKQREKGPFIVCVDTSESMYGTPEKIAKVLCLGILKMAAKENRRAYLINFSTGIETLDLQNIAHSIDDIAKFLQMSFYGGTDISLPLYEALKQLKTQNYQDADVLVISDFIMYKIPDEIVNQVKHFQQNKNTQFHSLTLSDDPNSKVLACFDTNWLYDPKKKGVVKELTHQLKKLKARPC